MMLIDNPTRLIYLLSNKLLYFIAKYWLLDVILNLRKQFWNNLGDSHLGNNNGSRMQGV